MKELSEYLKSERLKRGRSLKEMSGEVRVSVGMLQALEEGDFDRIGTTLLIRSFIRAYCSSLGIDPAPLLERYEAEIRAQDKQEEGIRRYGIWMRSLRGKRRVGILVLLILALLLAAAIYGGVWYSERLARLAVLQQTGPDVNPQQELPPDLIQGTLAPAQAGLHKEVKPSESRTLDPSAGPGVSTGKSGGPAVVSLQSPEAPDGTSAPSPPPTDRAPSDKYPAPATGEAALKRFEVEALELTWVQVRVDDKAEENLHLMPGEKRAWEARKDMKVVIGNPRGVRMMWEGKPLEIKGKPGSVLKFRLPGYAAAKTSKPR